MRLGNGFYSTDGFTITTKKNTEVVPIDKTSMSKDRRKIYKINFACKQNCHVLINGRDRITITPQFGFAMESEDIKINSFIIEEVGIEYYLLCAY